MDKEKTTVKKESIDESKSWFDFSKYSRKVSDSLKPNQKTIVIDKDTKVIVIDGNLEMAIGKIASAASLRGTFLRGIFRGLGTAIGATIVFGVLLALVPQIIDRLPFMEELLKVLGLDDLLRNIVNDVVNNGSNGDRY